MGLRLNDMTDQDAALALPRAEEDIARWEEAGPNDDDRRVEAGALVALELLARVFGREPQHDWCYYYERIDLARQPLEIADE